MGNSRFGINRSWVSSYCSTTNQNRKRNEGRIRRARFLVYINLVGIEEARPDGGLRL